jgi:tetratricopeptide (TPR) repeat protein
MAEDLLNFDALWDYHNPAKTEQLFLEVLPVAQNDGDDDYLAQLLTQISRTQGLQRKFDVAHQTLDEVKELLCEKTPIAQIRYLLERGRVYNSSQKADEARLLFKQAWDVARQNSEDYYAVDAAHMLGICETGDESLWWNERAMEVAEASNHPRAKGWLGSLYNNTGWTYHDMGNYERALTLFEKGLAWREERHDTIATQIAKWTVARTLRSMGRVEEALEKQRVLHEENKAMDRPDPYVSEEMGECLLALGHAAEAQPHFARAYEALSQDEWLKDKDPERIERLKTLAVG